MVGCTSGAYVCVHAYMRACVRTYVRACVRACVRALLIGSESLLSWLQEPILVANTDWPVEVAKWPAFAFAVLVRQDVVHVHKLVDVDVAALHAPYKTIGEKVA